MKVTATIKPNSRHREEVTVGEDGVLTVFTKAPAVEGRANLAAAELIAKHFGVSKSQVRLVRGHASKQKVFRVDVSKP